MRFIFSLAFLFGADNWKIDPTPVELTGSLEGFNKDKTTILDLGCGDGHDCVTLAGQGWQVIGVDFVPLAIRKPRQPRKKRMSRIKSPFMWVMCPGLVSLTCQRSILPMTSAAFTCSKPAQMQAYIKGLADVVKKDGLFLLKAFTPRQEGKESLGFDSDAVEKLFSPHFKVEKTSDHSYWRFPANWYWMRRL